MSRDTFLSRPQVSQKSISIGREWDWAWGEEAQFRSDVVPQVDLDEPLPSDERIRQDHPPSLLCLTYGTQLHLATRLRYHLYVARDQIKQF
jgi:hypothetical protein